MKKMLKIIAMLLVIATVVFAAGCAGPKAEENKTVATESGHENASNVDIPAENASENVSENVTVNATDVVPVVDNMTTDNETEENATAA